MRGRKRRSELTSLIHLTMLVVNVCSLLHFLVVLIYKMNERKREKERKRGKERERSHYLDTLPNEKTLFFFSLSLILFRFPPSFFSPFLSFLFSHSFLFFLPPFFFFSVLSKYYLSILFVSIQKT